MIARRRAPCLSADGRHVVVLDDDYARRSEPELMFAQDGPGSEAEHCRDSQNPTEAMVQFSPAIREFLDGLAEIIARDIVRRWRF